MTLQIWVLGPKGDILLGDVTGEAMADCIRYARVTRAAVRLHDYPLELRTDDGEIKHRAEPGLK